MHIEGKKITKLKFCAVIKNERGILRFEECETMQDNKIFYTMCTGNGKCVEEKNDSPGWESCALRIHCFEHIKRKINGKFFTDIES